MLVWLAVFVSDFLIEFLGNLERKAWYSGRRSGVWIVGLLTLVIGVNIEGFTLQGWWALIPSITGSMLGWLTAPRGLDKLI